MKVKNIQDQEVEFDVGLWGEDAFQIRWYRKEGDKKFITKTESISFEAYLQYQILEQLNYLCFEITNIHTQLKNN